MSQTIDEKDEDIYQKGYDDGFNQALFDVLYAKNNDDNRGEVMLGILIIGLVFFAGMWMGMLV